MKIRQGETSRFVNLLKMSTFGERLKQAFHNASNAEIARKMGLSEAAVKNYVDGRVPDADKLLKITSLTNCDLHWLLTGTDRVVAEPPMPDLGEFLEGKIREIVREEIARATPELETIGADGFDLEGAVKKYDNPGTVLNEWYRYEGLEVPVISSMASSDWPSLSVEEKVKEIRAIRGIYDRQRARGRYVTPKSSEDS